MPEVKERLEVLEKSNEQISKQLSENDTVVRRLITLVEYLIDVGKENQTELIQYIDKTKSEIKNEIEETWLDLTKGIEQSNLALTKGIEQFKLEIEQTKLEHTKEIETSKLELTKEIEKNRFKINLPTFSDIVTGCAYFLCAFLLIFIVSEAYVGSICIRDPTCSELVKSLIRNQ